MKSIRRSLIVYFLTLLSVAVLFIGGMVYNSTLRTLREKQEMTTNLLRDRHAARVREIHAKFDAEILDKAKFLAVLAEFRPGPAAFQDFQPIAVATMVANPRANFLLPLWLGEPWVQTPWHLVPPIIRRYQEKLSIQISAADALMTPDGDESPHDYFLQTYSDSGLAMQRSKDLAEAALSLDPILQEDLKPLNWHLDDAVLPDGRHVRCVTLKAPVTRTRLKWSPLRPEWRSPRDGRSQAQRDMRPPPPPDGPRRGSRGGNSPIRSPTFFLQFARDTRTRDQDLKGADAELKTDLDGIADDTQAKLADLQRKLLLTGLLVFSATLVGGCWIVGLGLSPLNRLSEAIRRVSVKDFVLPLDKQPLPRELRPIAARLRETLDLLRRAFDREKQAAADISHELRTPLSALLATTDVALRKPRTAEEYREVLVECRNSGRQMNQLVERMMALARLDAGADLVRPKEVNVGDLAETCADLVQPLARAHGLQLNVHCDRPVSVRTDPDKLREVVNNLLHNAVEYNRPGGAIDVHVGRNNGSVRLEVRDTGIGIAPEARERVFERFYRADPSRQADGLHAGLGLAISKSYMELLGGKLAVDSVPGEGSCFWLELPVQ